MEKHYKENNEVKTILYRSTIQCFSKTKFLRKIGVQKNQKAP